jgi:general secretion pathway protein N
MPKLTWFLFLVSALCVLASNAALTADNLDDEAARGAGVLAAPSLEVSTAASVRVLSAPAERPAGRARSANPLWEIPLEILSGTRERPVFSPSRRPPPVAVAQVAVAKPPPKLAQEERPLQLLLVGTVTGGDRSFGIFVDQTSKAALRLKLGEEYRGWRLRAVQGREATFARDQQTIVLNFPEPGTVAPVTPRVEVADGAPPADEPRQPHVHR